MNNRAIIIQDLIRTRKVKNQEELIGLLAERGIRTTQATLSRDLRKLRIYKRRDNTGDNCYILPDPVPPSQATILSQNRAAESVVSIALSGQMGVIKTLPGCASMVGAVVDEHPHADLMGTIAGDDTLLLILRQDASHQTFLAFLESFIPSLEAKLIL
jgi:transcriptional regulator of arginine metabolism